MAIVTWPLDDADLCPNQMTLALRSNVLIRNSTMNGEIQTSQIPGTRWVMGLTLPPNISQLVQSKIEALITSAEGQAHRFAIPHLNRRVPNGTMRGNPVSLGAIRGARSMVISSTTNATLLPGDMLGVTTSMGAQLIMVTGSYTTPGTGSIMITFAGPLRGAVAIGSGVIWNAPTAIFISTSTDIAVSHAVDGNPGVRLELMEVFG